MKPVFLLIFACFGNLVFAQSTKTPQLINFQAVAIDDQGNPLVNSFVLTRITVRQGGSNGTAYYCALHSVPTDGYGTFSFKMNQNATGVNCNGATNPNFDQIPWELGIFWLSVEYSYNSGQTYKTIDPIELASVPYALFAAELENVKTEGAVNGQVLKFDAITKQFEPANDETAGFSLYQGDGINITQVPGDPNIGVALADNGVTSGKLQDGSVTGSKLAPGSVSTDKLGIPAANGQVLKFNNGTWAAGADETGQGPNAVNITGVSPDITVNNLGSNTFVIQNTGVTTGSLAGGDINGPFSNLQINTATVTSNELAVNAVISTKIADGAITAPKLNSMGAVSGQVLKFSNGTWAPGTDNGGSGTSPWILDNTDIYNSNPGNVGIGTTYPNAKLEVWSDKPVVFDAQNTFSGFYDVIAVSGRSVPQDYYGIGGSFTGGYKGVVADVFPTGDAQYYGVAGRADGGSGVNYGVYGTAYGSGSNYGVFGKASGGFENYAGYFDGKVRTTNLLVNDYYNSRSSVQLWSDVDNAVGRGRFLGQYGQSIIYLGSPLYGSVEYPDNGYVSVFDADGFIKAGMVVDPSGQGVLFADVKNFKMEHPKDSSKEIWYASLEGPEAAAYVRGTGQIINGEALILFPDHFSSIANPGTLTVVLTPGSDETYGLAVVEKLPNGFKVKELKGGKGTFSFDWEAKAIRNGYENYQPVRLKSETPSAVKEKREVMFKPKQEGKSNKANLSKE